MSCVGKLISQSALLVAAAVLISVSGNSRLSKVLHSVASFTSSKGTNKSSLATDKRALMVRQRQESFTVRYDALYRWACRLTGDTIEAEDLLQDCYVAFVSTNTNAIIENLDGYLRRMLAYMLRSKRRREACNNMAQLEEAHELEGGIDVLAEIEERERQDAIKRQLRLIYNFAKRRNSPLGRTKAGKIFILRYYENKSGSEVAELTGSSRGSVDQWVRIARQEIQKRYRFNFPQ
jgi:RNA polymerase sigma factor (sigma-70 family)